MISSFTRPLVVPVSAPENLNSQQKPDTTGKPHNRECSPMTTHHARCFASHRRLCERAVSAHPRAPSRALAKWRRDPCFSEYAQRAVSRPAPPSQVKIYPTIGSNVQLVRKGVQKDVLGHRRAGTAVSGADVNDDHLAYTSQHETAHSFFTQPEHKAPALSSTPQRLRSEHDHRRGQQAQEGHGGGDAQRAVGLEHRVVAVVAAAAAAAAAVAAAAAATRATTAAEHVFVRIRHGAQLAVPPPEP